MRGTGPYRGGRRFKIGPQGWLTEPEGRRLVRRSGERTAPSPDRAEAPRTNFAPKASVSKPRGPTLTRGRRGWVMSLDPRNNSAGASLHEGPDEHGGARAGSLEARKTRKPPGRG